MSCRYLLFFLLLPFGSVRAQADSLLIVRDWIADKDGVTLRFTRDGTFEFDYGADTRRGRYLLGRYTIDSTAARLTLSVDYFLGQRRLPARYRRGTDFYLEFDVVELDHDRLILRDRLTDERRPFRGSEARGTDPAERPLPPAAPTDWKLPTDWGNG